MASFAKNSIDLTSIPPGTGPLDTRYKSDEWSVYFAYKGNLEAAEALGASTPALYHDAWLSLNIAAECYFKNIYCLIRNQFSTSLKTKKHFPLGPMDYDDGFIYRHKSSIGGNLVSIKEFDHEVMELWTLVSIFTNGINEISFRNLKNHIPTKSDWINARYEQRKHGNYKVKFDNYHLEFTNVLNSTTFGAFK